MTPQKETPQFQKLPMLVFDRHEAITYKNKTLEDIHNVKLKSSLRKIFSPRMIAKIEAVIERSYADVIEFNDITDCCAVLVIPVSSDENVIIYLPTYYSAALANGKSEITALLCKELLSCKAESKINNTLTRIRKTIYRNFELLNDSFAQCIDIRKLAKFTEEQLKICTFPLGIKLITQNKAEEGLYLQSDMRALATEILCMFDIILSLNRDKIIEFDVSVRFGRARFKLKCNTESCSPDDFICVEKYILAKVSQREGHLWRFSVNEKAAECTLTVPLTSNLEFSVKDGHTAEAVFCEAIKF